MRTTFVRKPMWTEKNVFFFSLSFVAIIWISFRLLAFYDFFSTTASAPDQFNICVCSFGLGSIDSTHTLKCIRIHTYIDVRSHTHTPNRVNAMHRVSALSFWSYGEYSFHSFCFFGSFLFFFFSLELIFSRISTLQLISVMKVHHGTRYLSDDDADMSKLKQKTWLSDEHKRNDSPRAIVSSTVEWIVKVEPSDDISTQTRPLKMIAVRNNIRVFYHHE